MTFAILCLLLLHSWDLPAPVDKPPVEQPFFKDRLHAYIWFNWSLVPISTLAKTIQANESEIMEIGKRMGLPEPPEITNEQLERLHCTIIRRNWHLLPYEQIMQLLGWDKYQLAYTLREDDFLFIKLGSFKPQCEPLIFQKPTPDQINYELNIAQKIKQYLGEELRCWGEPPLAFIRDLSSPTNENSIINNNCATAEIPKFCSSYFLQYGDAFLNLENSYPLEYIKRLRSIGVNGIWLQAVLYKLTPFPWDSSLSIGWEKRLKNLREFTDILKQEGVSVYLYLNEPRAMPNAFFEKFPELKGVQEGDFSALCTSHPEVQKYIKNAIKTICENVPNLGGFFTISASENLTNCWSHHHGELCPNCRERKPADVIAEYHQLLLEGISSANANCRLIAWDWGWKDEWVEDIIAKLPQTIGIMSVSEWDIPIIRGGVLTSIGEYCLTEPGPGPRAIKHWKLAQQHNHPIYAKMQLGTTWELGSVPYLPVLNNIAIHANALREKKLNGYMLGWTMGGYPSPNLHLFNLIISQPTLTPNEALNQVAEIHFGTQLASTVVKLWEGISYAFKEYPFHISTVYQSPVQIGPANPLYPKSTGYNATMMGFPYDDVDRWRGAFPPNIFANQMEKVANGFDQAIHQAIENFKKSSVPTNEFERRFKQEINLIQACAIMFRSVANQTRFVSLRNRILQDNVPQEEKTHIITEIEELLKSEITLAQKLYQIQLNDSRIGFEATNNYFFVPLDLIHKILNCDQLLTEWLPNL